MVHRGLEAVSEKDGAWYDVDCAKSKIVNTPEGPRVRIRFSNFGGDEDELYDVQQLADHFRQRSRPIKDSQCACLEVGGEVLGLASFSDERKWQDAVITEIKSAEHGSDECLCSFKLDWKVYNCPGYRCPKQCWLSLSSLCFISKPHEHLSHPFIVRWRNELRKRLQPADGPEPQTDSGCYNPAQMRPSAGVTKCVTFGNEIQSRSNEGKDSENFQTQSMKGIRKKDMPVLAEHMGTDMRRLPKGRAVSGLKPKSKKRDRHQRQMENQTRSVDADISLRKQTLCEEHENSTSSQKSMGENVMDESNQHNLPIHIGDDIKAMDSSIDRIESLPCERGTLQVDSAKPQRSNANHAIVHSQNLNAETLKEQEAQHVSPEQRTLSSKPLSPILSRDGKKNCGANGLPVESLQHELVTSGSGNGTRFETHHNQAIQCSQECSKLPSSAHNIKHVNEHTLMQSTCVAENGVCLNGRMGCSNVDDLPVSDEAMMNQNQKSGGLDGSGSHSSALNFPTHLEEGSPLTAIDEAILVVEDCCPHSSGHGTQEGLHSAEVHRVLSNSSNLSEGISTDLDNSKHTDVPFQPLQSEQGQDSHCHDEDVVIPPKAQACQHDCQMVRPDQKVRCSADTSMTLAEGFSVALPGHEEGEVQSMHVNDGRVSVDVCNELLGFPYVIDTVGKKVQPRKTCATKRRHSWVYNTGSKHSKGPLLQMLQGLQNGGKGMSRLELLHLAATSILDPGHEIPDRCCDAVLKPKRSKTL